MNTIRCIYILTFSETTQYIKDQIYVYIGQTATASLAQQYISLLLF